MSETLPGVTLYLNIAPAAAILTLVALFLLVKRRKETAVRSLIVFLALTTWLIITNAAEAWAQTDELTLFFAKLQYIAFIYIPIAWLSFCLRFTGWITTTKKSLIAFIVIAPSIFYAIILTNGFHGLFWAELRYVHSGPFSVLRPVHGPFFWLLIAYGWLLMLLGTVFVLRSFFTGQKIFYRQSVWIIVGVLIPGIANFINVFRLIPGLQKDFTPIGLALSGLCFVTGMYFHRLFWIMPVARAVILQNLPLGIIVLDRKGWIVDHNAQIDQVLGVPEYAEGRSYASFPRLCALLDSARVYQDWPERTQEEGLFETDGLTLEWSVRPSAGDYRGIILTVADITERIRLRNEMELIKSEFVNREKLATIGRITAGLTHEINNPLAIIKSDARSLGRMIERKCAQVLEGREKDGEMLEIHEVHEALCSGIDRIEELVGSLLAFSRKGSIDSKAGPFDLNQCISSTLDFVRYEFRDGISIQTNEAKTPLITGHKSEINQVLFNILTNAAQAIRTRAKTEAPGWKGLITITTGSSSDGSGEGSTAIVWCEIENNGNPIPEEYRERIFELFFTTKPEKWGTGLGLNLSREIVEKHHEGRLFLASADPVVFRLEFPARA